MNRSWWGVRSLELVKNQYSKSAELLMEQFQSTRNLKTRVIKKNISKYLGTIFSHYFFRLVTILISKKGSILVHELHILFYLPWSYTQIFASQICFFPLLPKKSRYLYLQQVLACISLLSFYYLGKKRKIILYFFLTVSSRLLPNVISLNGQNI